MTEIENYDLENFLRNFQMSRGHFFLFCCICCCASFQLYIVCFLAVAVVIVLYFGRLFQSQVYCCSCSQHFKEYSRKFRVNFNLVCKKKRQTLKNQHYQLLFNLKQNETTSLTLLSIWLMFYIYRKRKLLNFYNKRNILLLK